MSTRTTTQHSKIVSLIQCKTRVGINKANNRNNITSPANFKLSNGCKSYLKVVFLSVSLSTSISLSVPLFVSLPLLLSLYLSLPFPLFLLFLCLCLWICLLFSPRPVLCHFLSLFTISLSFLPLCSLCLFENSPMKHISSTFWPTIIASYPPWCHCHSSSPIDVNKFTRNIPFELFYGIFSFLLYSHHHHHYKTPTITVASIVVCVCMAFLLRFSHWLWMYRFENI